MTKLEEWLKEIGECVNALGEDAQVSIQAGFLRAPGVGLGRQGFPGVVSLWTDEFDVTVGLFARPGAKPEDWPCVVVKRGHGFVVASDRRTLIPQIIATHALADAPDTGPLVDERWDGIRGRVEGLHRILGGEQGSLNAVIEVARDPGAREELRYDENEVARFEAAQSRLLRRIDSSSGFTRYADWLDAAIAGDLKEIEAPETYGPWARRVVCSAQRFQRAGSDSGIRRDWLDWLIEGSGGVDAAIPASPTWAVIATGASGETALAKAARLRAEAPGDPLKPSELADGLAEALQTLGTSYKGLTHAEVAVALDEGGQPERAWDALQTAAWWSARKGGSTPDAIIKGILFLTERHGWEDLAWVVRRATSGESSQESP